MVTPKDQPLAAPPTSNFLAPHADLALISKIEDAFVKTGIKSERIHEAAFHILVHFGGFSVSEASKSPKDKARLASIRHSQAATLKATKTELSNLAAAAEKLTDALNKLQWPALAAIGYNPVLQRMPPGFAWGPYPDPESYGADLARPMVEGWHFEPSKSPSPFKQGSDFFTRGDIGVLQAQLRLLLTDLQRSQIPGYLPENTKGSKLKIQRMRVARLVAHWFEVLSGERAIDNVKQKHKLPENRTFGRYVSVLHEIFILLQIKAAAGQTALELRKCMITERDPSVRTGNTRIGTSLASGPIVTED